ncbi:hypothetical protein [Amycolatopsis sp. cmx-8-4]|uniref:hypothetical protein n=1 Tax=Amycolatopsis sp. cmx-8-4 TaxID=2790947 RepID=UPI00397B083F
MNGFLEELGKKAAERWLTLLVLPGVVWSLSSLAAFTLSHRKPLDVRPAINAFTKAIDHTPTTTSIIFLTVGILGASIAAGMLSSALAVAIRRLWGIPGRRRPARWLVTWRNWRWERHGQKIDELTRLAISAAADTDSDHSRPSDGVDEFQVPATGVPIVTAAPGFTEAYARRDAVSLDRPVRPTWLGDRWQSTVSRVYRAHGLDLTIAWPRLWSILPDSLRGDISTAQAAYINSSIQMAWAALYVASSALWWPLSLAAIGAAVTAIIRARACTETLCSLIETAADLHANNLAKQLAEPRPQAGWKINEYLRKDTL